GGSFEMGSNADPSERPIHRVTIAPFAIGKFMVTQGEWGACVASSGCSYKRDISDERLPMTNLSWDDAAQYAQWLSRSAGRPYRLASEAEWEYAARAGTTTPFAWGAEPGVAKANCNGCGGNYDPQHPAPVGSFAPNSWGIFDMEGGVAEWVEDCWHKNYDGAPNNGTAWQAPRCASHFLPGGSWEKPPKGIIGSTPEY